jgi:hypothetical protein
VSAHPRRVLADIDLLWPPGNTTVPLHVRRGSLVDIPPGSALETAYGGPGNLEAVTANLGSADTLSKAWLGN